MTLADRRQEMNRLLNPNRCEIRTFSGRWMNPLNPMPSNIVVEDISHALSLVTRWGGHTSRFYSVAEHSEHVGWMLPAELKLEGKMHDAPEAYLLDLQRPLKLHPDFGAIYREAELRLWKVIAAKFGMDAQLPQEVHEADRQVSEAEFTVLMLRYDFGLLDLERRIATPMADVESVFDRSLTKLALERKMFAEVA